MEGWQILLAKLESLADSRRAEGKRHSVGLVVLLSMMGVISGYSSYRAIGGFILANQQELSQRLGVKENRLPSYSTVRRVLMGLVVKELSEILTDWQQAFTDSGAFYKWLHLDGKALKGTVKNYGESKQDFINVVSLFYAPAREVVASQSFHNKAESEITVARQVIKKIAEKHVVFTADALHAQKNSSLDPQAKATLSH